MYAHKAIRDNIHDLAHQRFTAGEDYRENSSHSAPWLSWLERVTVTLRHHKVESSSLSGAVFFYSLPKVDFDECGHFKR